tara:strand:- start:201 stop:392 length:192 start_codon:yes stop_codon:yes gene_type:complete
MSDFWAGFAIAAIVFGLPRLFLGRFTIWEAARGWVMRFETTDARCREYFIAGRDFEKEHGDRP